MGVILHVYMALFSPLAFAFVAVILHFDIQVSFDNVFGEIFFHCKKVKAKTITNNSKHKIF
jgi:hypothetical protein